MSRLFRWMVKMPTLYQVLGVPADANPVTIKVAHRRMARKYHPDVNPGQDTAEKFKEIQFAYEVLSDPERRARYDATGESAPQEDPMVAARGMGSGVLKKTLIKRINMPHVNIVSAADATLEELR